MEEIRLNKFISDSGFCSRREADRFIESGSVRVNGRVAEMGQRVTSYDEVRVNGSVIEATQGQKRVYIALNKPVGVVSTTDPAERDNIVDFVNYPARIFNIGRLDKPSEGLILLTNDGNIVNKILRAANNHDKEYQVSVDRLITPEFLKRMAGGVPILGTVTKKCKIKQEGACSFKIILTQGLNRQIRRMCEYLGYEVVKLKRTRIMNISLGSLPVGHWRMLNDKEIEELNSRLVDSDGGESASAGSGAGKSRVVKPRVVGDKKPQRPKRPAAAQGGRPNNDRARSSSKRREGGGRRQR